MIRNHYFECRPDGTYLYLGGTDPDAKPSRSALIEKFFDHGITNDIIVIQGSMLTYQYEGKELRYPSGDTREEKQEND